MRALRRSGGVARRNIGICHSGQISQHRAVIGPMSFWERYKDDIICLALAAAFILAAVLFREWIAAWAAAQK